MPIAPSESRSARVVGSIQIRRARAYVRARFPLAAALALALFCASCTAWLLGGVEESRSAVAIGPDEFLEARASWRARRSFDPLSGTTLKSDYRAEFRRLRLENDRVHEVGEVARFRGWILPEASAACGEYVYFIGGEREGPGVPPSSLYRVRYGASAPETLYASESVALENFVVSPDGAAFALRLASAPEGVRLVVLESGPCAGPALRLRTIASLLHDHIQNGPAWSGDGRALYFETAAGVFAVDRSGAVRESAVRPARWTPASNQGGAVNSAGVSLYFDPGRQKYEVLRDPDWIPFQKVESAPSRQ